MIDEDVTIWKKELQEFLNKYKIPTNEELIFRQANENKEIILFITVNRKIDEYYLYKIKNGKSRKSKTSNTVDFKELDGD